MRDGNRRALQLDDLVSLSSEHEAVGVAKQFEGHYVQSGGSVYWAMFRMFRWELFVCGLCNVVTEGSAVFAPVVLRHVIDAFAAPQLDLHDLAIWLGCFFASRLLSAVVSCHSIAIAKMLARRIYVAFQTLLFSKSMRKSVANCPSDNKHSEDVEDKDADSDDDDDDELEMSNLITNDVDTIKWLAYDLNEVWIVPTQVIVLIYLLYDVLGLAAFAGVAVIGLSGASGVYISKGTSASYDRLMYARDARLKSIKETFGAMQLIKLNAWERKFAAQIQRERNTELKALTANIWWKAVSTCIFWSTPLLVSIVSFTVYALVFEHELTASTVFASIALFNALREPLEVVPDILGTVMEAKVSLDRIKRYLVAHDKQVLASHTTSSSTIVQFYQASIGWDSVTPVLKDVALQIQDKDFCVVYGGVGAGKSSLCAALLGEMEHLNGYVAVRRVGGLRVAYAAQQPWIQHMSIRDNIVFGQEFDATKYERVLDACGLRADLALFPAGDATEIGEKGVNLSGGQKARVSLARACYYADEADLVVLDAPLAAVDALVQREIFDKCLCTLLQDKTIVLVTHNIEFLHSKAVNHRIHVHADGSVSSTRHAPAPDRHAATFERDENEDALSVEDESEQAVADNEGSGSKRDCAGNDGTHVEDEEREQGRVSSRVYFEYLRALGGAPVCLLLVMVQLLWQGLQIGSDLWLSYWTGGKGGQPGADPAWHMAVYSGLALRCAAMVLVRAVTVAITGLGASKILFAWMTSALLAAPQRFFDTTPIGRVLNRYSNDVEILDAKIPTSISNFLSHLFFVICQLGTAVYMVKIAGVLVVPLALLYACIGAYYLMPYREISRLQKISSSPVLSYVTQTEEGIVTLRGFGPAFVARAAREQFARIDLCTQGAWNEALVSQWFGIRVKLIGALMVIVLVSALVYLRDFLAPGVIALAFTYMLNVESALTYTVRYWAWLEVEMVSTERMLKYIKIEGETTPNAITPPPTWPANGCVQFENVVFRYGGATKPAVLKDVTFTVKAHEKIGIVGRTGAGKSSMIMALFRMNALSGGSISIDGIDLARVPLEVLRSRLSIIPQTPVLFRGSLRAVLDPLGEFSDVDVWSALRKVNAHSIPKARDPSGSGLDLEIEGKSDRFSVGERQLLCMARALLRQSKIIIFDEATASIDHATELHLQQMLATEVQYATVLTIAHRLSTIIHSNRVLVMSNGRVVEFDEPRRLVQQQPRTMFYDLAQEGGVLGQLVGQ
ncbi:TPA: hypothetical protein N0F65_009049 [Lagenidium giganteum]|uniref:Uncharacterized protein n=1 Tax=Lagenidium giganteum TaxID=4803 RepID=A0AAV2YLS6_9STRA|nr:TPA: hypothetical protein N0F65_009049 [Lagenidium giganteum]